MPPLSFTKRLVFLTLSAIPPLFFLASCGRESPPYQVAKTEKLHVNPFIDERIYDTDEVKDPFPSLEGPDFE